MVTNKQNVYTVFGTKLILYSVLVIVNLFVPSTIDSVPEILYQLLHDGPIIFTPLNILAILLLLGILIVGLIVGASFMKQGKDIGDKKLQAAGGPFFWYHLASLIAGAVYMLIIFPVFGTTLLNIVFGILISSLPVLGLVGWIMMLAFFVENKGNKLVIPGMVGSIIAFSGFAIILIDNFVWFLFHPSSSYSLFPISTAGYITCAVCFFIIGSKGGLQVQSSGAGNVKDWARSSTGASGRPSKSVTPNFGGSSAPFQRPSFEPGEAIQNEATSFPPNSPSLASAAIPGVKSCNSCSEPLPLDADMQFCPNCGSKIVR